MVFSVLPLIESIETKTDSVKRLDLNTQIFLTFCFLKKIVSLSLVRLFF